MKAKQTILTSKLSNLQVYAAKFIIGIFLLTVVPFGNAQTLSCNPVFPQGNLVSNSSFTGSFDSLTQWNKGWTPFDPKSATVDACGDGSGSLYIKGSCYPNGGVLTFDAGKPIIPGQRYRILAKIKNESAASNDVFNIVLPNSVWNLSDNYAGDNGLDQHNVAIPRGTGWYQFDQLITAGANAAGNLRFLIMSCDSQNLGLVTDFLYIDDFQIYPVESDGTLTSLPDTDAIVSSLTVSEPLIAYTDPKYSGDSKKFGTTEYYTTLGEFDNTFQSFILKKGFMVTFASNTDGTGYSRVYTAQDNDVIVPVMPAYLNETVSYIRVRKLNMPNGKEVTKKGWAGWNIPEVQNVGCSWRYDWSAGGSTTDKFEYVPIKQNLGWPGFGEIEGKQNVTQVLGYNEPDRPDQANISNDVVIGNWKYFMKSGLRLGSPAHSDPYNGLWGFMSLAKENNYRVDFITIHAYWSRNQQDWSWRLDDVYNAFKRPIWITEWNNGANWTNEAWPDASRLCTDANAAKQLADLTYILGILESKSYVERYAFYNAVQDCRAVYLIIDNAWKGRNPNWESYQWLKTAPVTEEWTETVNGIVLPVKKVLTPAGVYYRDLNSKKAFEPPNDFVPTWKPFAEVLSYSLSQDFKKLALEWTDKNFDLVSKYVVERKLTGETSFSVLAEITDYAQRAIEDNITAAAEYRIKVIGKDGAESAYSNTISFTKDVIASPPADLKGTVVSSTIVDLTWTEAIGARGYNIVRATSLNGTYEIVAQNITGTAFRDITLDANGTYYYKIASVNSGGVGIYSVAINLNTPGLQTAPQPVISSASGGDGAVNLLWSNIFDVEYYVKRSTNEAGPYTIIATVAAGETQYQDNSVANGTVYYYKVSAFNELGESEDSKAVQVSPKVGQYLYFDFNEVATLNPHDKWGNHSATVSATTPWVDGKTGDAIKFGGSSYLDIEDGIVENFTDFTISTWVKLEALSNWTRIFDFGSDTNYYMFLTPQNGADGHYRFAIKNGGTEQHINCSVAPIIGTWTHVAVTLNGTVGVLYINGQEVGRNDAMTINPSMLGKTTQNYIGKSQYPDPLLSAAIDEFRIYENALTANEIASLAISTPTALDDDQDGVYNYKDLCSGTPAGATVNVSGCALSQIDTDNDGVSDNLDQCPDTPVGATVNANGCSDGQLDDDNDGVINSMDLCPNTPAGEAVNATGCFALLTNNFVVTQLGESCPDKNNGQITVYGVANYSYTATVNNTTHNFVGNELTVSNLVPGTYEVCLGIQGKTFKQCYSIVIPKSKAITAKTVSVADKVVVEIESGTAPYQVLVNGIVQFETNNTNFDVGVAVGDLLEVKTSKLCEGTYSKEIILYDAVKAFPNPTLGEFDLYLPTNNESVDISIFNSEGKKISSSTYQLKNGKVHLNIENEPSGIYFVKINSNPGEVVQIIKK